MPKSTSKKQKDTSKSKDSFVINRGGDIPVPIKIRKEGNTTITSSYQTIPKTK